jgi:hypothetical protein
MQKERGAAAAVLLGSCYSICVVILYSCSYAGHDAESSVPPEHRNTYLGVLDRLEDIKATGATAVLLANVFLSSTKTAAPGGNGSSSGVTVDGPEVRRPLSYFAPDTR